jgi:hypothetical protein
MKPRHCQWVIVFWMLFLFHASATVLYVDLNSTNPVPPYADWTTAATNIQDAIDASTNGDQILVTNGVYKTGGRLTSDGTTNRVAVTNAVTLQSINGPTVTLIDGGHTMRCIYLTNGAMLAGFILTNGNAGNGGGAWCSSTNVLLANCLLINNTASSGGGIYSGTLTNCTLSGNTCPPTFGNGGGAAGSILNNCTLSGNVTGRTYPNTTGSSWGGGASGCTLTGNISYGAGAHGAGAVDSTLNNCVLSGGYADQFGGGAYDCTLTNCTLSDNYAGYGGGGVSGGTLYNCVLTGNRAGYGGGVYWTTTLNNCTLCGNSASYGGGGYGCTLNNCIVYYNHGFPTDPEQDNYGNTLNYCCTPTAGDFGNITNAPLFVNQAGGNFHLQTYSPCINAGNNAYVTTTNDLDGNPRIVGGTVDAGAYENQSATASSGLPSVPTSLTAVLQGGHVALNWPVSFKATGYNIYRAMASTGSYTNIASGVSVTNYADAAIVNGETYFYFVTAVNAYAESAGSPQAIVYVVDHFAFAPIPTPQTSSVPFTVTISACNSSGLVLTNFNGAAMLSGAGDHGAVPLSPLNTSLFVNGQWTGAVTVDPTSPDTNIRLTASSNGVSGTSSPFNVVAPAIQVFNGLLVVDLVYNPFTQRLYAVAPAAAAVFSNSLIVIDPMIGRIETSYYLGDDPGYLSVSSDGQFVYIGFNGTNVFRRFNLATHTIDLQVALGNPTHIAALPGLPHSVAVNGDGIAIFDDDVERSNTYPLGDFVVAGSANELFTMAVGRPSAPFARLTVDASGVTGYTYEDGIVGYFDTVKYQAGLLFTSSGTVFNADTANILGHLTNCSIVEPDLAAGRIFSMGSHPVWGQPDAWTLYAWNATNLQVVGSLAMPFVSGGPSTLVRWGTNGIAIGAPSWYLNQFFLVRTPLVPAVPPVLTGGSRQASGPFQLNFKGDQSIPYTVWASTNLANWTPLGPPSLVSNGWFWFWDVNTTNYSHRFYRAGISQ